ncbi:hypothetical protein HanRHA438_Chr07g0326321 [Helianthus annuus]|nr:hypothetical protein HanRHA438_Chr07g0326321 [Helianthus annuus]
MIGRTIAVNAMISLSWVNIVAHKFLTLVAKSKAENPNIKLHASPTSAARFAQSGRPAPNSLPTRVDTLKLNEDGNMYINAVVCIKIPIEATVARGFTNNPHSKIMISYHHHSRQTDIQLGIAKLSSEFHPFRHSLDTPPHVFL